MERDYACLWKEAFGNEMRSLITNDVFEVVPRPRTNIIGCRWVLNYKFMPDGGIKPKARLVAKGYSQRYGVDYNSTFAPVVDMDTVRFLFATIALENLDMMQFDVKTAFLHGDLEEEIFMGQPGGYSDGTNRA